MPWVYFTKDFDWYPPELNGRFCLAYKAGTIALVTTPCAVAAKAARKAVATRKPRDNAHDRR